MSALGPEPAWVTSPFALPELGELRTIGCGIIMAHLDPESKSARARKFSFSPRSSASLAALLSSRR
jgi:hypothetical protein